MKKRVIRLTESELKKMIQSIIEEQTVASSFAQGKTMGMASGQQARQAVNQAATAAVKGLKETVITIGKIHFKMMVIGGAVVYLIGKGIYKVGQAAGNAILKFLSATGKAVVRAGNAISDATVQSLNAAGIALSQGMNFVNQKLASMKDSTVAIAKWAVDQFKQFGTQMWAKILVAAGGIKEFSGLVANHLKNSWASIQNQIGVAWDQASNWARGAFNTATQAVKNTANQIGTAVKNKASQFAQSAARGLGNVMGGIQGFLQEMYERYLSFSNDTETILSEAIAFNGKEIL